MNPLGSLFFFFIFFLFLWSSLGWAPSVACLFYVPIFYEPFFVFINPLPLMDAFFLMSSYGPGLGSLFLGSLLVDIAHYEHDLRLFHTLWRLRDFWFSFLY